MEPTKVRSKKARFVVLIALLSGPSLENASANSWVASGAVGGGAFAGSLASSLDVGLDLSGERYSVGLGARLHLLADQGVRSQDWDQPSEMAQLLRYAFYSNEGTEGWPDIRLAFGSLGSADMGSGSVVSGFTTAINADRHRVGAQFRGRGELTDIEFLVDDIASPRIFAGRGRIGLAGTPAAGLITAVQELRRNSVGARTTLGAGAEVHKTSDEGFLQVKGQVELIGRLRHGMGIHIGTDAKMQVTDEFELDIEAELVRTKGGYTPWRYGALYEVERFNDEDTSRSGTWARAKLRGTISRLGKLELGFQRRVALPDLTSVRVELPAIRRLHMAGWFAFSAHQRGIVEAAMAVEARANIGKQTFLASEFSRRYQETMPGNLTPFWSAFVSVGLFTESQN